MKKKTSFGTAINFMFLLLIVPMIIIAVAAYTITTNTVDSGDTLYTAYGKAQGDVGMGFAYFQEVKCNLRNSLYLYADDEAKQAKAVEAIQTSRDNMNQAFDLAKKEMEDKNCQDILEEAREYVDSYLSDVDTCVSYINNKELEKGREHLLNNGVDSANAAADSINSLVSTLDKKATSQQSALEKEAQNSHILILLLFLLGVADAIFAIRYINKKVKHVIVEIAEASIKLSQGDVHVELPTESSLLEIDELLSAYDALIKNLKKQAEALKQIAQGDLRVDFQPASDTDTVGNALAKLIHDDNSIFHSIRNATNQISLGSSQIAAASQTLAQGSTEQASAIQQIAASITDIAGKTKNNAEQADSVNEIVLKAKDDVNAGNARMEEMVAAMNEINEVSENIQKIIKVIDDIAFNTNILALNATVEAARAGEQGKGFAVVAEEVRNLAGRSAEASSQTAEMIADSIAKVKRGGELAKQTEEALALVSSMIEQITGLSEDIAKASNEQASATAQIDQALMQVSQVVQTNSATSQQCASASEELSGQARGLNQELSRFQLKDVIGNMPSQTLGYEEPAMLENNSMKY